MDKKEIWISPWTFKRYYQVSTDGGYFKLCLVGGSLSSILSYPNKEVAIRDGWRLEDELDNKIE
jgi:hypothetical protein